MSEVRAYHKVEYIGPKRDTGDSKTFHNWTFDKSNKWTVRVPTTVAEMAMQYPKHFKVYDETSSHPEFSGKGYDEVIATILQKIERIEERLPELPKEVEDEEVAELLTETEMCTATTGKGDPCKRKAGFGENGVYCGQHAK